MTLDPTLTSLFASSRDPLELKHYWTSWRDATGKKMTSLYKRYVEISNEMAKLNGYHNIGELWRRPYEDPLMPLELWSVWGYFRPLYEQLHAYVRRRLFNKYGPTWINLRGTIPAHLLGNMWAQNWGSLWDILAPFSGPQVANMDVSEELKVICNYSVVYLEFFLNNYTIII